MSELSDQYTNVPPMAERQSNWLGWLLFILALAWACALGVALTFVALKMGGEITPPIAMIALFIVFAP